MVTPSVASPVVSPDSPRFPWDLYRLTPMSMCNANAKHTRFAPFISALVSLTSHLASLLFLLLFYPALHLSSLHSRSPRRFCLSYRMRAIQTVAVLCDLCSHLHSHDLTVLACTVMVYLWIEEADKNHKRQAVGYEHTSDEYRRDYQSSKSR